jgi:hypothetical protein
MSGVLERLSSIIFRLALILCVLTDFTATVLLCITFIGIGWAGWYASSFTYYRRRAPIALSTMFAGRVPGLTSPRQLRHVWRDPPGLVARNFRLSEIGRQKPA